MSNLESELDIVINDEGEMEEIGKSISEGVSMKRIGRAPETDKDVFIESIKHNTVVFESVFKRAEIGLKRSGSMEICGDLRTRLLKVLEKDKQVLSKGTVTDICTEVEMANIQASKKIETPKNLPSIQSQLENHKENTGQRHKQPQIPEKPKKDKKELWASKQAILLKEQECTRNRRHWSRGCLLERSQTFSTFKTVQTREIEASSHTLPSVGTGPSDGILRVSAETVAQVLTNKIDAIFIDCRFEYEYNGGHIAGAKNIMTQIGIMLLFNSLLDKQPQKLTLIFYCEYSSVRAPKLASYLRNEDRRNSNYPSLYFPNVYIMEGGYKEFYKQYPEHCVPCNYIPM
ncbi:hypothetical protein NEOKW01_0601 [Nematocida sp. AWRm80]|nr:hypothetical protein NEOKW01_0601 [Nematocida sp. AWRm80]